MDRSKEWTPSTVESDAWELASGGQGTGRTAVPVRSLVRPASVAIPGAGVGLRGGAGPADRGCLKDEELEDYKRAVLNEIVLDFGWYCRAGPRSHQDMKDWWRSRENLVDALLEDAWPAWGTVEALERCRRFTWAATGTRGASAGTTATARRAPLPC